MKTDGPQSDIYTKMSGTSHIVPHVYPMQLTCNRRLWLQLYSDLCTISVSIAFLFIVITNFLLCVSRVF